MWPDNTQSHKNHQGHFCVLDLNSDQYVSTYDQVAHGGQEACQQLNVVEARVVTVPVPLSVWGRSMRKMFGLQTVPAISTE